MFYVILTKIWSKYVKNIFYVKKYF